MVRAAQYGSLIFGRKDEVASAEFDSFGFGTISR